MQLIIIESYCIIFYPFFKTVASYKIQKCLIRDKNSTRKNNINCAVLCKFVKITMVVQDSGVALEYKLLHNALKGDKKKDIWCKTTRSSVMSVTTHTRTHSFTLIGILLNHAKKAMRSASNPRVVTSPPTGFTRSPLSSTKGQNNNIMVSTECLPPSKNISVRVGLTYLFSHIKTQSRVYSDSCCPGALWRTEGELWRSWPSGTIKRNHQTLSWDRLLTHRSKCLLEIIHIKL